MEVRAAANPERRSFGHPRRMPLRVTGLGPGIVSGLFSGLKNEDRSVENPHAITACGAPRNVCGIERPTG